MAKEKALKGIVKTIMNGEVVSGTVQKFKGDIYSIKVAGEVLPLKRHREAVWK